jgi:hypothetical protein
MSRLRFLPVPLLLGCAAFAQTIPLDEAARAFATARAISAHDAGRTWGMEVYGPMLFVDAETNNAVANQPDAEGILQRAGEVWQGKLPRTVQAANTATDWAGVRWTMVMWPLPQETRQRAQLLAHECYHRVQPALKLPATDAMNSHLDGQQGRTWMLLEWRALERALVERGEARGKAVTDALRFRQYRRTLIASAAASENALEMNEGLAEYTGVALANDGPDRRAAAISMLRNAPDRSSLARSFAYASGPAYGVLLDESGVSWRNTLTPASDLGAILAQAYKVTVTPLDENTAAAVARSYGGDALIAAETTRARKREAELADLRHRFIDGPVLVLPVLGEFSYGFNPNGLTPLSEGEMVYRPLNASDRWGVLEAKGGGMLVRQNGAVKRVVVPAPRKATGNPLAGEGWTLELKPGYKLGPGPRSGDWIVEKP